MEDQEALYTKGFNGGYLLEQYEPNLLAKVLTKLNLSNDYFVGLSAGQKEYQQELIRLEYENLHILRERGKDTDHDLERK